MKPKSLSLKLLALLAGLFTFTSLKADIIVTWENNAGDLVIRWNGDISNWTYSDQYNLGYFNILQGSNGMHALNGNVDVNWTGSSFNWYTGPEFYSGGVLAGDSFGTSGLNNWVYMPYNYAGQMISGSQTWAGQGALISDFHAGSRDLGFGSNDNIVFRAASVPDSGATVGLLGLGLLGFVGLRRRFAK